MMEKYAQTHQRSIYNNQLCEGSVLSFLRKGEDIPVFHGGFTIEHHYEFLSSV